MEEEKNTKKVENSFERLNAINVNDKTENKNGLTYLSWAWAWAIFKKEYPTATYEIKKFENNLPYVYDEETGYMVFTSITVENLTHEMWLPVIDNANKTMKKEPYIYQVKKWNPALKQYELTTKDVEAATMFDINKTIMRCLVKNMAMFGLGLYIYAGEDLPEEVNDKNVEGTTTTSTSSKATKEQITIISKLYVGDNLKKLLEVHNLAKLEDMTNDKASEIIKKYTEAKLKKQEQVKEGK